MIIAGLMAGTSVDGLDVALVEFHYGDAEKQASDELSMRMLAFREVSFSLQLATDILRLLEPADVPLSKVSSVDARFGQACADAVATLCEETGLECDLVVSHGQTIRHDVDCGKVTSTLQLGQPAWIAERTGSPVLCDVRARDVAAGGQGAPLTGLLDHLLLAGGDQTTAALNLGGIANITVVSPYRDTTAFDTGPANALIDVMARRISGDPRGIDHNGALAAQGRTDPDLLDDLLDDPYYQRLPPKTTGKELFHSEYLDRILNLHSQVGALDVIATLTTLTARTVADACQAHQVGAVVASGGGTRNPTLMSALRAELGAQVPVRITDDAFGIPESSKEACLMALMGWLSWHGLSSTLPSATGAAHETIGGALIPGRVPLQLPTPLEKAPARLRVLPRGRH